MKQRLGDALQSNHVLSVQMREIETKNAAVVSELRGTITSLEQEGSQMKQRLGDASQSNHVLSVQMREMETKNAAVVSELRGTILTMQGEVVTKERRILEPTYRGTPLSSEYGAPIREFEKSSPRPPTAVTLTVPRGSPSLSVPFMSPSVTHTAVVGTERLRSRDVTATTSKDHATSGARREDALRLSNSAASHPTHTEQLPAVMMMSMRMRVLEVELHQARERIRYLEETY